MRFDAHRRGLLRAVSAVRRESGRLRPPRRLRSRRRRRRRRDLLGYHARAGGEARARGGGASGREMFLPRGDQRGGRLELLRGRLRRAVPPVRARLLRRRRRVRVPPRVLGRNLRPRVRRARRAGVPYVPRGRRRAQARRLRPPAGRGRERHHRQLRSVRRARAVRHDERRRRPLQPRGHGRRRRGIRVRRFRFGSFFGRRRFVPPGRVLRVRHAPRRCLGPVRQRAP